MRVLTLVVALSVFSCAAVQPTLHSSVALAPASQRALLDAVEAVYRAETPAQLTQATTALTTLAQRDPALADAALFHDAMMRVASLAGDDTAMVRHLMHALRDVSDDVAVLHLHQLMSLDVTVEQQADLRELLSDLVEQHPSQHVRAVAASHLAQLLTLDGDLRERDELIASVPGQLHWAVTGTWDNDSGKAFDLALGPEVDASLTATYAGRTGPLRWRRDAPLDPRGRLDFGQLMTPSRWAAAYAQAAVTTGAGAHLLSLTTGDPVKVWVDGRLVFSAPQLDRTVPEQIGVPLWLSAGLHRVLIKSAHRDGAWLVGARLVSAPEAMSRRPIEPPRVQGLAEALAWQVRGLPADSARTARVTMQWAHLLAGGTFAVQTADAMARQWPRSIAIRHAQVLALWFNQERGRTADLIQTLDADVGDALPNVRLRSARFVLQQGQRQKARQQALEATRRWPSVRDSWELLADVWRAEGWVEDELSVQRVMVERFATAADFMGLSSTLSRMGRRAEAVEVIDEVLQRWPGLPEALRRRADMELEAGAPHAAVKYLEARLESWPVDFSAWMLLAEAQRRAGRSDASLEALQRAEALCPEASLPLQRAGDLAYEAGTRDAAVTLWKRAVHLNPENEALANRVDFHSPEARGAWQADAPDEAAIAAAVKSRATVKQVPGADVAWLIDHEVTLLNSDGSTSNIVTAVVHTFNAQGKDRVVRQSIPAGRLRVLHSYSIDEKGVRTESSEERNRQIFFRGMQAGSTLVLQYRLDTPPQGYLSRYLTKSWSFQSMAEQRSDATFIVWAPVGVALHEQRVGAVERSESKRGEQLRVEWRAVNMPPLVSEPNMPTTAELAANIRISTVPDWKTYLSWEQALLEGVFRDSPELDAVAKHLGEGAPTPAEKLTRIHQFVMEEIRYQQDYESFIAGVKPHPAPMVLERRYGDCKDKAVLFIELAKKVGLDAHFALVRTRDAGPVMVDVPMQQFNHAIVYVPEQPGVAARFYDPTAELLDVDAVRADDVGTKSLVFNPVSGEHTWRDIEFQAPEVNATSMALRVRLDAQGGAKGTLGIQAVGRTGSSLRRAARNAEILPQVVQRVGAELLPNASTDNVQVSEMKSLRTPVSLSVDIEAKTFARADGDGLRLRLPSDWHPRSLFSLATRRHPLVLGTPGQQVTLVEVALPEGFEVKKAPATAKVELPCLSLSRDVVSDGRVVKSRQTYRTTCERISAAEYLQYRARVDDMVRLLDDELVLVPTGKGVKPKAAASPSR